MTILARALRHPSMMIVANVGAQSAVRFVSNILLARLLAPEAFALTSITMLILTGIHMATDVGIAVMTLRHGAMSERDEARMWTMQFLRGIGLAVLMFAAANPIARLYASPQLVDVMRVLGLMSILQGAQSLYPILRLAERDLMPTFWVEVAGRALGAAISVLVALAVPTVWALVTGMLAQALFSTVLSHLLSRKGWPRLVFDLAFMRGHWGFSRWIQLGSMLTFVAMQIDKAVFPLLYGLPRFGVYGIGATFAMIPAQITQKWSASVFYPMVAQKIGGGEGERAVLRRIRLTMLLYTAVVAAGVMAVSPGFFYLLYRPAYHEAARFSALLAGAFFFELAESSLRHFPLVETTSRYEFTAVIVRLALFLLLLAGIRAGGGGAYLYAVAYTCGPAGSYLFMLWVCARRGYVRPAADLGIAGAVAIAIAAAYLLPVLPASAPAALAEGGAFGLLTMLALAAIYARRGLPSLPAEPPRPELEAQAKELALPEDGRLSVGG